jgi:hypothetical protein
VLNDFFINKFAYVLFIMPRLDFDVWFAEELVSDISVRAAGNKDLQWPLGFGQQKLNRVNEFAT